MKNNESEDWITDYPKTGSFSGHQLFGFCFVGLIALAALGGGGGLTGVAIVCMLGLFVAWVFYSLMASVDRNNSQICPKCHHIGMPGYVVCGACGYSPKDEVCHDVTP